MSVSVPLPAPLPPPDEVGAALVRRADRLRGFASRVLWHETVGSTNDVADRAAAAGAAHGTAVLAAAQTGGRGRTGHTWFSPPGAGLYVSVVLRPESLGPVSAASSPGALLGALASSVTLTTGVAIADALRAATAVPALIKWPNDIVVGRRKLCGILAEAVAAGDSVRHVVLGFGINLRAAVYPRELADRAGSLEEELGRPVDGAEVLGEALACMAEDLRELSDGGFARILDRWRTLSPSSEGASVSVLTSSGWRDGLTAGVDDDGALLARVDGTPRRVIAGEVNWR